MARGTFVRRFVSRPMMEAVVLVAVLAGLYWPYLRLHCLTTGGDMANLFYPLFTFAGESITRTGVLPLWNPFDFSGHPLAAAAQSAVFYPPGRALYLALSSKPVVAMNLFILAHLLWAGLGTWGFTRSRTGLALRGLGPWCAGLAFAGSAWWWGQVEHAAALATTAWLPWLVWAAGRMVLVRSARSVAWFSLVLALQLLAGHPQEAFYSVVAAAVWAAWSTRRSVAGWCLRPLLLAAGQFLLGAALGGLVASIQLLPTMELSEHSYRRFDSPDYAAQYSMPPRMLSLLLLPHPYGSYARGFRYPMAYNEYGLYVGVPALALAAAGWWGWRRRRRSGNPRRGASALWSAVALGAVLLALGGHADFRRFLAPGQIDTARSLESPELGWSPLALLVAVAPPVRHFRVPARILVLWSFSISLLAAMGIRHMECRIGGPRGDRTRKPPRGFVTAVGVGAAALTLLSLFLPSLKERMAYQADYRVALDFAREVAIPIPDGPPLDNRLFRLTLMDDEFLAQDGVAPSPSPTDLDPDLATRVALRAAVLSPNLNLPVHRPLMYGYEEGLLPTVRYKDFLFTFNRAFRDADPDARLLALGGARWLWSELPIQSTTWEQVNPADHGSIGAVYRNKLWRGMAFDKNEFPSVDWSALDGAFLHTGEPALERNRVRPTYTTPPDAPLPPPPVSPPTWTVALSDSNTFLCRRRTPAEGDGPHYLIVAQAAYPGWIARNAEGRRLSSRMLNAWNTEIDYGPADTLVRFSYEPWSFRLGAFLSLLGLAVLASLCTLMPRSWRSVP